MQHSIFLLFILAVILSCENATSRFSDNNSVAGTYVKQAKSEFSVADDTLSITPVTGQKNLFSVKRTVSYQRIIKKGARPKESRQETATAIWEPESRQLKEQKYGRLYALSEDGSQLMIGATVYTKLAN